MVGTWGRDEGEPVPRSSIFEDLASLVLDLGEGSQDRHLQSRVHDRVGRSIRAGRQPQFRLGTIPRCA